MRIKTKTAFLISFFVAVIIGGTTLINSVYAAGATIYVSPSSKSVNNNETFSLAVRANTGGSNADAVNLTLTYDASKLQFVSAAGGGPISSGANYSNSNGVVAGGAYTVTPASGDILLMTVTFKALAGSGSTAVGFSQSGAYGTSIDGSGASLGASISGATVSFTTPVPSTPAAPTTPSTPAPTTKPSTPATPTTPSNNTPSTPQTPSESTGTDSEEADPIDAEAPNTGDTVSSLKIGLYDKNMQPLRNKKVILHSDPQEATSDKDGFATFTNVPIGEHTVTYNNNGTDVIAVITVSSGDTQSVVFDFAQVQIPWTLIISVIVGIALAVALFFLGRFLYKKMQRAAITHKLKDATPFDPVAAAKNLTEGPSSATPPVNPNVQTPVQTPTENQWPFNQGDK